MDAPSPPSVPLLAATSERRHRLPGPLAVVERGACDGVDAGDAVPLCAPVTIDPCRLVRRRLRPGPPAVGGLVHVEVRVDRERVGLVGDGGVEHLQHEHALAGVGGEGDEGVPRRPAGLRQGEHRPAAAVAQHHDGLGAAPPQLLDDRQCVDDEQLVEAVDVVVDVAGGEAEDGIAGRRQRRREVVDREVGARMAEGDAGAPRDADGRGPEDPPDDGSVGRDQRHRFTARRDTRFVGRVGPVPGRHEPQPRARRASDERERGGARHASDE